ARAGGDVSRHGRADARRGVRRRAEAADHARHLRALGRLLRRVLRAGAAGADAHRAGARVRVREPRRARHADLADGRVPDRGPRRGPSCDVRVRPAHDPVLPGRAPRAQRPVRLLGRAPRRPAADRAAVQREQAVPRGSRARARARARPRPGEAAAVSWEPVIGLEIHVQLKTRTKMFCRCPVGFGAAENSQTCPVCLGFPGALPVPNRVAIEWVVKLGLALGCEVAPRALCARKNDYYPDLPKGYQISQYDLPSCINGNMIVPLPDGEHAVGIVRAHLEEDAAKNVHVGGSTGRIGGADYTLVDYNRGGTPLVEIVTAPDIHSAEEAKRFLQLLRQTIVELGISHAEMETGALGVAANVSVRPEGSDELRTRCEIKNMNSFSHIARGIDAEVARQVAVWESGGQVEQHTYDFDVATGTLTPRRTKEEADDYRYFPEPDLVPVEPSTDLVERLRAELPELPADRIRRGGETPGHARALLLLTCRAGVGGSGRRSITSGRSSSSPAGSTRCGVRRWPPAPTRSRRATSSPISSSRWGSSPGPLILRSWRSSWTRGAASRGEPSTTRSPTWPSRASARSRTSSRTRSGTRVRSSRSSTRFSPRTRRRSSSTGAARRACSASSSGR